MEFPDKCLTYADDFEGFAKRHEARGGLKSAARSRKLSYGCRMFAYTMLFHEAEREENAERSKAA